MIFFITIALDAAPYIYHHINVFNRLSQDFRWLVVEGTSLPVHCTSWCKPIPPRLSEDGSHNYLSELAAHHPRVVHIARPSWDGKVSMFNAALEEIEKRWPVSGTNNLLWEVDADELWSHDQIERMYSMFCYCQDRHWARFFMRYFVGQNIICTTRGAYGNNPGEWLRVWRYYHGMRFASHEPPSLQRNLECGFTNAETEAEALVPDHFSYALESQLVFKSKFYPYPDAVAHWRRLQANTEWPVRRLKDFLPWVDERATADLLFRP